MRVDDTHACPRCGCKAHDLADTYRGKWCLLCFACCNQFWVESPEPESAFRFSGGRFDGLTIAEAAGQPNGLDYVRCMARDKNNAACKSWLDRMATTG